MVPVLGGEPEELLPNAAALTWADPEHVLFSEIKTGVHMGIATATESRAGERDVYLPADLGGMAHRSWLSPDGKWILVSEMDRVRVGAMPRASFRWEQQRRDRRSDDGALHVRRLEPGWQDDVLQRGCGGRIPYLAPAFSRMACRNN